MRRGAEMIRKSIIDRLNAGVAETEYPDEGIETAELNMIEAAALIGDLTEKSHEIIENIREQIEQLKLYIESEPLTGSELNKG
jgi:hypothetical protein